MNGALANIPGITTNFSHRSKTTSMKLAGVKAAGDQALWADLFLVSRQKKLQAF
jgi:hypothetical protein